MSKKRMTFAVTVSVPDWMTKAQAGREVRTLINEQCNCMSAGPLGEQIDETTIRAVVVKPMKKDAERREIECVLLRALTMGAQLNTPDFLDWVADRLVHVYGENPNVDFVQSLRLRAEAGRAAIAMMEDC